MSSSRGKSPAPLTVPICAGGAHRLIMMSTLVRQVLEAMLRRDSASVSATIAHSPLQCTATALGLLLDKEEVLANKPAVRQCSTEVHCATHKKQQPDMAADYIIGLCGEDSYVYCCVHDTCMSSTAHS